MVCLCRPQASKLPLDMRPSGWEGRCAKLAGGMTSAYANTRSVSTRVVPYYTGLTKKMTTLVKAEDFAALIRMPKKGRYQRSPKEDRTLDGIVFDSKREMARWAELKQLERANLISDLERQPTYPFPPGPAPSYASYRADFKYIRDGVWVVEDVKSSGTAKDPVYRLKKRALRHYYGIKISEVTQV